MFIKITDHLVLYIKGYKNSVAPRYIQTCLTRKNLKLFKKVYKYYEKRYDVKNYYEPVHNRKENILIVTPEDFYEFAKKHDKIRPLMSKTVYDSYQVYNMLMLKEKEYLAKLSDWLETKKTEALFHNIGLKELKNKKYLKKDSFHGYLEAIYNESGELVFDGVNDGTYNHYYYKSFGHNLDILWWLFHGVYGKNNLKWYKRLYHSIFKKNILERKCNLQYNNN